MLRSENVWRVADVSWWFDIHKCSFYLTMRCGACKMGILDRQIPNWRQWCYFYSNAKQKYFNLRKDLEIATNKNSQNKCYVILSMTLSCISKIFFLICIQMSSCISKVFMNMHSNVMHIQWIIMNMYSDVQGLFAFYNTQNMFCCIKFVVWFYYFREPVREYSKLNPWMWIVAL